MAEEESEDSEAEEILELAKDEARPKGAGGRPATARRRKQMMRDIANGTKDRVDRGWLLEEYLRVYYGDDCKAQDKKAILDSISRLSGYGAKQEEPESDRDAIMDLMKDMRKEKQ